MKYCTGCGIILDNRDIYCKRCGKRCNGAVTNPNDTGSVGWGILGFLVPIVGLILFLVWRDEQPKNAKNAGIGALVNLCSGILLGFLYFVLIFVLLIV